MEVLKDIGLNSDIIDRIKTEAPDMIIKFMEKDLILLPYDEFVGI